MSPGFFSSLFFPAACVGCGESGPRFLCEACINNTLALSTSGLSGITLWNLGRYDGLLAQCISKIKSRGHKPLARELVEAASRLFLNGFDKESLPPYLLACPPSVQGRRFRGFSIPQMLETEIHQNSGWPLLPDELRQAYKTTKRSSKGMGRAERAERQPEPPDQERPMERQGRGLLLIDDVVTTGSTLRRCIDQAKRQGFESIKLFALAEHRPE